MGEGVKGAGAEHKTVVLFGKGDAAIQIGEWFLRSPDYVLAWVVPVIPEPTWTGSLAAWATAQRVPVVASGHFRDLPPSKRADGGYDLGFSVFYDRIFKADAIARFGRLLNLHNAPLPKYRGVSPINWALHNNEPEHGVTIHEITPGVDDGPIVGRATYSIHPAIDEVVDVFHRGLRFGWLLFQETMPRLDQIPGVPQDHAAATHYTAKDNDRLGERRYFTRRESRPR